MAKRRIEPDQGAAGPFNNPFASLGARREALPAGPAPQPEKKAEHAGPPIPPRAVLRLERKGRGGKEVTVVEQLGLKPAELERWLKELKQSLGCGGAVEGETLVIQGDHRERLRVLLVAGGVKRVSVG